MRRINVAVVLVACAACGEKLPLPPPVPASISIEPSAASVDVGGQLVLTVIVNDGTGTPVGIAKPPALTFTSRRPSVAAVDSTGRITAMSLGSTYIVATYKSQSRVLTDSAAVFVVMPVSRSPDAARQCLDAHCARVRRITQPDAGGRSEAP